MVRVAQPTQLVVRHRQVSGHSRVKSQLLTLMFLGENRGETKGKQTEKWESEDFLKKRMGEDGID